MKSFIRAFAFLTKEVRETLRQPSLMVVLILGPFLILLLFGLGHSPVAPPLKTIVVVPASEALPIPPDQYQALLGNTMQLVWTTDDEAAARARVVRREVDLVVSIPSDLYERLAAGQQAPVTVLYDEIDPTISNYIRFVAAAQTAEMNRMILEAALKQTVAPQGQVGQFAEVAGQEVAGIEQDLRGRDTASAQQRIDRLEGAAAALDGSLQALAQFVSPMAQGDEQGTSLRRIQDTRASLAQLRDDLASLRRDVISGSPNALQDVATVRTDVAAVNRNAGDLQTVPAQVVAAPLVGRPENLASVQPDFVAFYAPAVLALLLQHIAVTFGALSIVRERLFGAMELFRVAPVSTLQIILGKYLAYLLFGCVITVVLTFLIVQELRVPFIGSYDFFAAVVAALLLSSLGIGFGISLLSNSERQAVQLSMLTLIASVFFSGFFLRLESFSWPTRGVAYLLPVTYGIQTLQDVMLRGRGDNYLALGALSTLPVLLLIGDVFLLRRELRRAVSQTGRD